MVLETVGCWKSVSKYVFHIERFRSGYLKTHVCESTFSTMKQVESKNRNQLANETVDNSLRLAPLTLVLMKER